MAPVDSRDRVQATFAAKTDVGRVRRQNEDNFLIDKKRRLYVVCDGMGGHAAGAVASAVAVNAVRDYIVAHDGLLAGFLDPDDPRDRHDINRMLEAAVQHACLRIFERALRHAEERGMGTTLTLLLLLGDRAFFAHVGDSRLYLLRSGHLYQLSEDHSLLAEMVKNGRIKATSEVDPRFRNAVTRAVGVHETVEVDTADLLLLPGDRFLLCSDGLTGYADCVTLREVIARTEDDETAVENLVSHANGMGGADNITAVMTTVVSVPRTDDGRVRLILSTVRRLGLFKYLDYAELLQVMNITEERHVGQGERVFGRGDAGKQAFVIVSGRVRVMSDNVVIALLEAGRHFGEMALVDDQPRSADALAVTDCHLLLIPRAPLYDLMRQHPALAVKLLWSFIKAMAVRLRLTTNELGLVRQLFHAVSPEEETQLPTAWLPPDDMRAAPRRDTGELDLDIVDLPTNPDGDDAVVSGNPKPAERAPSAPAPSRAASAAPANPAATPDLSAQPPSGVPPAAARSCDPAPSEDTSERGADGGPWASDSGAWASFEDGEAPE